MISYPSMMYHTRIQFTTTVAIFPLSSIKQFQNINLTLVNWREHFSWKAYDEPAQTEPERGRGARVTGLRPYPCLKARAHLYTT